MDPPFGAPRFQPWTKNASVFAIGRAPRPAPSTSRITPPMPVPAPP